MLSWKFHSSGESKGKWCHLSSHIIMNGAGKVIDLPRLGILHIFEYRVGNTICHEKKNNQQAQVSVNPGNRKPQRAEE